MTNIRDQHLRNHLVNHPAADVGQAVIASLESVGELFVIDSHQVQNRGVQIVDMYGILCRVVAEVIRLTDRRTASDTATSHPNGEGILVMVTPGSIGKIALQHRRSTELSTENDECF